MSPTEMVAALKAEGNYTSNESRAFKDLKSSNAYQLAAKAMARMMLSCGDMALEDGNSEYWRGVKRGLGLFFEITEGEAERADELLADVVYKEDNNIPLEELEGVDLSQAISALGSSPL